MSIQIQKLASENNITFRKQKIMRLWIVILTFLFYAPLTFAQQGEDEIAIKELLVESYVEGIHINRKTDAVRIGFHPDFLMHVYNDGQLIQAPLEMWLERLNLDGIKNTKTIKHSFDSIDITGNSAVVKMQIYEDSQHLYTDYFGLYRFEEGWKIVNKIFYSHN